MRRKPALKFYYAGHLTRVSALPVLTAPKGRSAPVLETRASRLGLASFKAGSNTKAGFTLLEVLIAFVIASLAIAALFGGTAGGLDATAVAAKYDEAISLARSHLAAIGHGEAIHLVETSGAEGENFTWHLRVRAAGTRQLNLSDQDRANDIKATAAVLYDVVVTESWKSGGRTRQITLATRRFDTVQGDSP